MNRRGVVGAALALSVMLSLLIFAPPGASAARTTWTGAADPVGSPVGVTARPIEGGARVTWHTPVVPSGRTLMSYVVRVTGGATVTAPAVARSVTFTGLPDGLWRVFTVTALYDDSSRVTSAPSPRVAVPVLSGWSVVVTGGRTGAVVSDLVRVRPSGNWDLQLQRRKLGDHPWTTDVRLTTAADGSAPVGIRLQSGSWQWRIVVTGVDDSTQVTSLVGSAPRGIVASTHACVWGSRGILVAPRKSGHGKRIIWSKSANQVWLVEASGAVRCSYAVTDNDEKTPVGTYHVRIKSPMSSAVTDGKFWRLPHMVSFYLRPGHVLWIGFHAVPISPSGHLIQPLSSLGKPGYSSHGCVRQHPINAANLYAFSRIGTKVVVIA